MYERHRSTGVCRVRLSPAPDPLSHATAKSSPTVGRTHRGHTGTVPEKEKLKVRRNPTSVAAFQVPTATSPAVAAALSKFPSHWPKEAGARNRMGSRSKTTPRPTP